MTKSALHLLLTLSFALPACVVSDDDDDTGANTDIGTGNTDVTTTMSTTSMSTTVADDTAGETPADDTAGETPADDTAADTGTGEMACVHSCAEDADCLAMGTDIGLICTETRCVPS
ncbi:MAG: hypothetical protein IAG13_37400, partial [Deltaproteobacteria bacterium]|nr:hypothetical protein [Nannocystaceae bacterium]